MARFSIDFGVLASWMGACGLAAAFFGLRPRLAGFLIGVVSGLGSSSSLGGSCELENIAFRLLVPPKIDLVFFDGCALFFCGVSSATESSESSGKKLAVDLGALCLIPGSLGTLDRPLALSAACFLGGMILMSSYAALIDS